MELPEELKAGLKERGYRITHGLAGKVTGGITMHILPGKDGTVSLSISIDNPRDVELGMVREDEILGMVELLETQIKGFLIQTARIIGKGAVVVIKE